MEVSEGGQADDPASWTATRGFWRAQAAGIEDVPVVWKSFETEDAAETIGTSRALPGNGCETDPAMSQL